ncbi:hypothetical protein ACOMHN_042723 [Nucella lapillus]
MQSRYPKDYEMQSRYPKDCEMQSRYPKDCEMQSRYPKDCEMQSRYPKDCEMQSRYPKDCEMQSRYPKDCEMQSRYPQDCEMQSRKRCPVPGDTVWKRRDEPCGVNKTYHCIEDRSDHIVAEGCYKEKLCVKGAYPVVEGNHIRCIYCPKGSYQRIHGLRSSTYGYSYCEAHSPPCKPEYGQSLCRPGTREENRACSCNASLGFVSRLEGDDCSCFTPDDACAGCKFSKCPDGSEKNDRGFCEPRVISTTPPSEGECFLFLLGWKLLHWSSEYTGIAAN